MSHNAWEALEVQKTVSETFCRRLIAEMLSIQRSTTINQPKQSRISLKGTEHFIHATFSYIIYCCGMLALNHQEPIF